MARRNFLRFINFWPPLLGAGIRVTRMDPDMKAVDVELRMHFWNRNYVGTHYGGSLYSVADAFYMLMLIHHLGSDFIVWDKSASIRFRKPGRGTVRDRVSIVEPADWGDSGHNDATGEVRAHVPCGNQRFLRRSGRLCREASVHPQEECAVTA